MSGRTRIRIVYSVGVGTEEKAHFTLATCFIMYGNDGNGIKDHLGARVGHNMIEDRRRHS